MSGPTMIPLGYMLKRVASPAPDWMGAPHIKAIHSVSGCVSTDIDDYVSLWQHNGWWLFDTPDKARSAAMSRTMPAASSTLFYYEAFHRQYDDASGSWEAFGAEDFPTGVVPPHGSTLNGFDVVTFHVGTAPECSPLSCNGLAATVPVNQWCLFDTFDHARTALESGGFRNTEPGVRRIVAVYAVEDQPTGA